MLDDETGAQAEIAGPVKTPAKAPATSAVPDAEMGSQAEEAGPLEAPSGQTPEAAVTPSGQMQSTPDTGVGGVEALLIAAGLVIVLFVTRRLRAHA